MTWDASDRLALSALGDLIRQLLDAQKRANEKLDKIAKILEEEETHRRNLGF